MSILKDFRFTVDVQGGHERVVDTTADGGLALPVATPPEFRGGVHGQLRRSQNAGKCRSIAPRSTVSVTSLRARTVASASSSSSLRSRSRRSRNS
jgi:hypothetical protein